jgi:type I restriction enzyme S subunit
LVRFVVNKSNNGRFLYFFTNSKSFYAQIELETIQTTIENFNGQKYANMRIAIPPLPDQTTIANFLDKKTAKIDALIEKDKKLIVLLKEKRTALINHAVTKGLDPNVKLKDSGIQWIGEIPEGWKVKKLKLVSNRIGDGIHTTPNYVDISDSYFINGNNLVNGRIKITKSTRCVDEIELKKHRQPLNERTLLLSINGTIGNLAFYKGEQIILGKSAAYINLKKKIKVKYVYYFFHCNNIKYYFMKEVTGSTIWNLSLDSVKKTPILYPSSSEQIKIVQYLDKSTSKIDKTIKFIEKKIVTTHSLQIYC